MAGVQLSENQDVATVVPREVCRQKQKRIRKRSWDDHQVFKQS